MHNRWTNYCIIHTYIYTHKYDTWVCFSEFWLQTKLACVHVHVCMYTYTHKYNTRVCFSDVESAIQKRKTYIYTHTNTHTHTHTCTIYYTHGHSNKINITKLTHMELVCI